jgi:hypothetical protein
MLSFYSLNSGLFPPSDPNRSREIWTRQNMLNGIIIIGLLGLAYSLFIDGFGILAVFNAHPSSLHGVSTVCILVGIARIVAAIHRAITTCAADTGENLRHFVVDIREVERPPIRHTAAAAAASPLKPVTAPRST